MQLTDASAMGRTTSMIPAGQKFQIKLEVDDTDFYANKLDQNMGMYVAMEKAQITDKNEHKIQ